mgnify:FL=1
MSSIQTTTIPAALASNAADALFFTERLTDDLQNLIAAARVLHQSKDNHYAVAGLLETAARLLEDFTEFPSFPCPSEMVEQLNAAASLPASDPAP